MKTTAPAQGLKVHLQLGKGLRLYRIVKSDIVGSPEFEDSFRSHYELGRPPRLFEVTASVIHMGISMFASESQARGTAEKWPKLGEYLAFVDLQDGQGFNVAKTGGTRGHLTIWGDPVKLSEATFETRSL